MAHFPSWMKMAKDPDSVGAQFLDVFGLTFAEFEKEFNHIIQNFYISTANTELVDWLYKIPLKSITVDDAEQIDIVYLIGNEDEQELVQRASNLRNFYNTELKLPAFWIDRVGGYLYLRIDFDQYEDVNQPFKAIEINGAKHYDLMIHQVWNVFDEFGLLLNVSRLPFERNEAFKERILDVFRKPGNSTKEGTKNGLARELGISPNEIDINGLSDETFKSSLIKSDGTPSERLMRYAKQVNETLKFTWDTMNFGEAYWFSVEQDNLAIEYLPHVWDVDLSGFKKTDFQSGIGFGDDLLVHPPKQEESYRPVTVSIGLMGYVQAYEEIYPEIVFTYKVYAEGKIVERDYQPQPFRYTVEGTEVFNQDFRVTADADIRDKSKPNISGPSYLAAGTTAPAIQFGKSTDFLHTQTDGLMRLSVQYNKMPNRDSGKIQKLDVVWEDTMGTENKFSFETENDFLIDRSNSSGNPMTNVVYSDVSAEEGMTLGYGAFQDKIDTTEEWRAGEWELGNVRIANGTLSLNLDRFNPGENGPRY